MTGPIIEHGSGDNDGTPPTSKEQIEGYLSNLKSLIKEHNSRGDVSSIHLNFNEDRDTTERCVIMTGQKVVDAYLKRPFKETVNSSHPEDYRRRIRDNGPCQYCVACSSRLCMEMQEVIGKDKVINMIRSWPDKKMMKLIKKEEGWMSVPITFPPISLEDISDEPIIMQAGMEGYLVRRIYVDQGALVKECRRSEKKHVLDNEEHQKAVAIEETKLDETTYQRLVASAFLSHLGRNLEAYVDDMGIKSNDEKTKALADILSLRTLREMQSLSSKLAALDRFFARSAERSLPFFDTLKNISKENKNEYRWTKEFEMAFQEMKKLIMDIPSLNTPMKEEALYVYLATVEWAVSIVLLTEIKGKQCPVNYVTKTLNEAEKNYALLEKLALSLLHMSWRLRSVPVKKVEEDVTKTWTLFTDGASNSKGFRAGLMLISPSGMEYTYALLQNFTKAPENVNDFNYGTMVILTMGNEHFGSVTTKEVEELLEEEMLVSSSNHLLMVMWMREDHHFVQKKWECRMVGNQEVRESLVADSIYIRKCVCLVFLVLVLCVVHPHDQSPSISCLLTELNLCPPFSLSFVVANGEVRDCQGGLWWGRDSKAKRVCLVVQEGGRREVGMIWSFSVLGVFKSTKIPFVCEYGLTNEWDSKDLTKLLERGSDEFVLNHERDKNDDGVISLKSDLTIKV
nr:hypothetical protein [Tanacetum cinerariifolium]